MFEVCFQYDESSQKWEVIVKGAKSPLEALQGFNAVLITASEATPKVECNKATIQDDLTYKISIGL